MSNNWFAWALLSAAFAALTAIFAKNGLAGVDLILRRCWAPRSASSYSARSSARPACGRPIRSLRQDLVIPRALGLCTGASWVCYFRALKIGNASKVAPVDKLSVLLVALFAVAFLGERPSARVGGIAMVGAGVFVRAFSALNT